METVFTLTKEQITEVFRKWSKDLVANPDEFKPQISKEDEIEEYANGDAEAFIRYLNQE